MRVVLATSLHGAGPIEQALVLARHLVLQDLEVDVVCATPELCRRVRAAGARPALIPLRHQLDVSNAVRLARLAHGADVVHAHDRRAGLWVRLGPRPRRDGVRVYSAHGLPGPYLPPPVGAERPGLAARAAHAGVDAKLNRRADAVVVQSRSVATAFVERLGYPGEKVHVIPNGVDVAALQGLGTGALVGTMSVLDPVKGLDIFLRAAALLARERPGLRFAIFGEGPVRPDLEGLLDRLDLRSLVTMPGTVPAREALGQLRIFALPSWYENSPMGLLEAMAAGIPAVASAVGGIPEVAGKGTVSLVEPGRPELLAGAIGRLLDDADLASAQAQAARTRVEASYTGEENARAMALLYRQLLEQRALR